MKAKWREAPYQTQMMWWCLVFTTDGGRAYLRMMKHQPGGQLESCRPCSLANGVGIPMGIRTNTHTHTHTIPIPNNPWVYMGMGMQNG